MADPSEYPGTPRWVKVAAIVSAAVLLAMAVVMLLSAGRHGPGRHLATDPDAHASSSSAPVSPHQELQSPLPPASGR